MNFAQKLDQLILIAGVTNSKLAQKLNVDPSYVSKWRTGSRSPVGNDAMLHAIADALAAHVVTQDQQDHLEKSMLADEYEFADGEKLEPGIYGWLKAGMDKEPQRKKELEELRRNISQNVAVYGHQTMVESFAHFGPVERERVLYRVLDHFSRNMNGEELLIYTDEHHSKSKENRRIFEKYLSQFANALPNIRSTRLLCHQGMGSKGVANAIDMAASLCGTGSFYPMWMKGFSNVSPMETCIIAVPGVGSFTSLSWQGGTATIAMTITDGEFLDQFLQEFNTSFENGEPIFKTIEGDAARRKYALMAADHRFQGDVIFVGNMLPGASLPPQEYYALMCSSLDQQFPLFFRALIEYEKCLEEHLQDHEFYLEMPLFSPEEVRAGAVSLPYLPTYAGGEPIVGVQQYLSALRHLKRRCERFPNLIWNMEPPKLHDFTVVLEQGVGIYYLRSEPFSLFYGSNMQCEAHWKNYEQRKTAFLQNHSTMSRQELQRKTVERLEIQINRFESSLKKLVPDGQAYW